MKVFSLFLLTLYCGIVMAQQVEWFTTTHQEPWSKQKVKIGKAVDSPTFRLNLEARKQQIIGVGGCFNEMGWDAVEALPVALKEEVLRAIFGEEGAHFNYCRMPIGANDFALNFYSLDDVPEDFHLINFSIDRDRYILIPYIKAARNINPTLQIWASPWCPPMWMKTNNHYASNVYENNQKDANGLTMSQVNAENSTAFRMTHGYLSTYANYFVRFIEAYQEEGIDIEAIYPQNEPCSNQNFPSCKWRSEDLSYFIGRYLGPAFEKAGIQTKILFGTVNTAYPEYVRIALEDKSAARYIAGVGFQWDGKKSIPFIHNEYPHLILMQTETECGDGANSWEYAEYTWHLMEHYFHNGINSYHYWNMILPSDNISRWGWRQNSMVVIDKKKQTVTYTPEYYVMKHLAHYLQKGAYRLDTPSNILAFVNPDNTVVVMIANTTDLQTDFTLEVEDKSVTKVLMPHSFHTLLWKM